MNQLSPNRRRDKENGDTSLVSSRKAPRAGRPWKRWAGLGAPPSFVGDTEGPSRPVDPTDYQHQPQQPRAPKAAEKLKARAGFEKSHGRARTSSGAGGSAWKRCSPMVVAWDGLNWECTAEAGRGAERTAMGPQSDRIHGERPVRVVLRVADRGWPSLRPVPPLRCNLRRVIVPKPDPRRSGARRRTE